MWDRVVFENDRVRLLEYRGKPGDKTAMHSHPDLLAYALSGGSFKFTVPDGQTFDVELKAGDAMFAEASPHATEQTGSSEVHVLLLS